MSKTYKTITQTKTTTVIDSTACDICGKTKRGVVNWDGDTWGVESIAASIETGKVYPEGGSTQKLEYDICPECFMAHVVPFLSDLGATGTTTECEF